MAFCSEIASLINTHKLKGKLL